MLTLSLFLHVVAAVFWVGGMLFLVLVIVPFVNTIEDFGQRAAIYQKVGTSFRFWGWVAIATLVVTGPLNLHLMGIPVSSLFDPVFHSTPFGKTLMAKVALVVVIIISSVIHDFYVGPGARSSPALTRWASYMGRSNLVVALVIILLAVMLRTG